MIKKNENGIMLSLNRRFYSEYVINSGIERFRELCKIEKEDNERYYLVNFSGMDASELEDIVMEFANYILFLMKSG